MKPDLQIKKPRILTVDDSSTVLLLYKNLLDDLDLEIDTAQDGQEGFNKALAESYDLIISDVDMPKMDGIQLCRKLRTNKTTSHIPIIISSTFDSEADIERSFKAGASAYLCKNEVKQYLTKTVKDVIQRTRQVLRQKILIVDDSRTIQRVLEAGLKEQGYQVVLAPHGQAALDILKGERPDLILSDINMPVMDGFSFCKAVKADTELAPIPFVVMSTNNDRAHMNRMVQYGAAAYLVKPFNISQLTMFVEKILSDQFLLLLKERQRLDLERHSLLGSITSLISALEARDSYTRGHSEGVSTIAAEMVTLSGASKSDIEKVAIGARLHDIGKIGVRDSVLLKPGRLTDEEFEQIKQHPGIGKSILEAIPSLHDSLAIVFSHHEQWNGSGYPEGLRKTAIPFWARITAVADIFHALTSNRPYREAMPFERAFSIIREERERQLCPESVDLFFQWIDAKSPTESYYPDLINPETIFS